MKTHESSFDLQTLVVTSSRSRGVREISTQPGHLVFSRGPFNSGGVCFRTNGGTWYLSTLLGLDGYSSHPNQRVGKQLSIDHGQGWTIENMDVVLDEIIGHEAIVFVETMLTAWIEFFARCCTLPRKKPRRKRKAAPIRMSTPRELYEAQGFNPDRGRS